MFNIIWEFIINLLESFLFAVICNAKFTKRQYHYHTAEQTLFILCKSLLITLMNISKKSSPFLCVNSFQLKCNYYLCSFPFEFFLNG